MWWPCKGSAIWKSSRTLAPPRTLLPLGEVPGLVIHPGINGQVRSYMRESYSFPVDADALILTDDYNPIDFFDAGLRETVRGLILQNTVRGLLTQ